MTDRTLAARARRRIGSLPRRAHRRMRELVAALLALPLMTAGVRARLYRVLLGHRVIGARIVPGVQLIATGRLSIGRGAFINTGCLFDLTADIDLAELVHLAPRVSIYTSGHEIGPPRCRAGAVTSAPVRIGAGTWIGANAVILPGVRIGPSIVVGAGSVVTADLVEPGLYAGTPARFIKDLPAS